MDAESSVSAERQRTREEDDANWRTLACKLERSQTEAVVTLDVGGVKFKVSLATLTAIPDSYFGAMFSGRWEPKASPDGCYFIDRDPAVFSFILNFLRTVAHEEQVGFLSYVPVADWASLLREAEFYSLKPLVKLIDIGTSLFAASALIGSDPGYAASLCQFLESEQVQVEGKRFPLLYRASRDGWSVADFHARCDHKGATLVVVQSGPYLFGGYTSMPWDGSSRSKHGPAFLFSLRRPNGGRPGKLAPKQGGAGNIYCRSGYGPTFGGGYDLHICGNSNSTSGSHTSLGHTYTLPADCPPGEGAKSYLAGAHYFTVTEIEVLQIN